jgi:xanthosine utilization system XapX-like protein
MSIFVKIFGTGLAILFGILGFFVGAFVIGIILSMITGNTGVVFWIGGIIGAIVGVLLGFGTAQSAEDDQIIKDAQLREARKNR